MATNKEKSSGNNEILLAQWQTCVEMANATSQRRDAMNNIFVTVNLAIIAAVTFVWDIKSIFVLVAGIIVCSLWLIFIRNFKLLNTAKFEVINTMEKQLPAKPFSDEWNKLQKTKKYYDSTKLESVLPWTFIFLYVIAAIIITIIRFSLKGGTA